MAAPPESLAKPSEFKLGEILRSSYQALKANKARTMLTALGLVIGNASVILVVTISLTSTEFILEQIRGIGSNLIWAYYETGTQDSLKADSDYLKLADVEAIRQRLGPRIVAATGVLTISDRMIINGREEDVQVIGADEYYPDVRNLVVLAGRFMDASDVQTRQKVAMLNDKMSQKLFGGPGQSIGRIIKIRDLEFTVIGAFKERTQSFGLSELTERTMLIPISVVRNFSQVERIDPLYVQARRADDVEALAGSVRAVIESRHRPGARYLVDNLGGILDTAKAVSLILTIVLILVSAIALVISGIGIMNIMLVTVTERTREIGLRMAVGASRRAVMLQFLAEAVLISVGGGLLGMLFGVAIPLIANEFAGGIEIRVSGWSVAIAFAVSFLTGLVFGLLPASRASRLSPTEALRYE